MYAEHFKEKIRTARKEAGYTQQQVSDATGTSRTTICRLETGEREPDLLKITAWQQESLFLIL